MIVFKQFSWDNGFDFEKAYINDSKKIKFPGIVHKSVDDLEFGDSSFSLCNMSIEFKNNLYYIGDQAIVQGSSRSRNFDDDKFKGDSEVVKLLASIEYFINKSQSEDNRIKIENLLVGLNISGYRKFKEDYEDKFSGSSFTYKTGDIKRKILIDNCKCFPQGVGSYYDSLLNKEGTPTDKSLLDSKVGLIDIGGKTTDACIFDYDAQLVKSSVLSIKEGTTTAFKYAQSKTSVDSSNLQNAYLRNKDLVAFEGEKHKYKEACEEGFANLAQKIYDEIRFEWINEDDLDFILLTGGGASAVRKHLEDYFNEELTLIKDPQYSNARGYVKLFKMKNQKEKQD